jgi:hypothetical protein
LEKDAEDVLDQRWLSLSDAAAGGHRRRRRSRLGGHRRRRSCLGRSWPPPQEVTIAVAARTLGGDYRRRLTDVMPRAIARSSRRIPSSMFGRHSCLERSMPPPRSKP